MPSANTTMEMSEEDLEFQYQQILKTIRELLASRSIPEWRLCIGWASNFDSPFPSTSPHIPNCSIIVNEMRVVLNDGSIPTWIYYPPNKLFLVQQYYPHVGDMVDRLRKELSHHSWGNKVTPEEMERYIEEGAEGISDVDWRPTDSVSEDYYAG